MTSRSPITLAAHARRGLTITELAPGNRYTITVTASDGAGSGPVSDAITAMTTETGKALYHSLVPHYCWCCSPQLPLVLLSQSL